MSFQTESEKAAAAKPYVRLEMVLDSGTKTYSHPEHTGQPFEEGRVQDVSGIRRSIDVSNFNVQASEGNIKLDNADGGVSEVINNDLLAGRTGSIILSFKDSSGVLLNETQYKGPLDYKVIDPVRSMISIRPKLRESIGIMQRSITSSAFPDAPNGQTAGKISTLGKGQNIIYGTMASDTGGPFEMFLIDETANAEKLGAAQHSMKSFTALYQLIGDVFSTVGGGDYTFNNNQTDGDGKTYSGITFDAGIWQAGARYFGAGTGIEDNDDGSGTLVENPVDWIKKVLIDHSLLTSADIDDASFTAVATIASDRDYDDAGENGGVIPWTGGQLIQDPLQILQAFGLSFGFCFYQTRDGKIAITDADISELDTSTSLEMITVNDLTPQDIKASRNSLTLTNKARVLYSNNHRVGFENIVEATDDGSVAEYGETQETELPLRFVRDLDTAKDVSERLLLKRGGKPYVAEFATNGHHKISTIEVGDNILITHKQMPGVWTDKQFKVISKAPRLVQATESYRAVSLGDVIGPVSFLASEGQPGEATVDVVATLSTFYGSTGVACSGQAHNSDFNSNSSFGTLTYMQHGFHFADQAVCFFSGKGWGDNRGFMALRFNLPAGTWAARTISKVVFTLQVLSIPSLQYQFFTDPLFRSGWGGGTIQKLANEVWLEGGTHNNIDGVGTVMSNSLVTTLYTDSPGLSSGTGPKSGTLNAAGLTAFQNAAAATGEGVGGEDVNISWRTFNADNFTRVCQIASTRHGTTSFRPKVAITYTV